jgi:hypothetical protein
MASSPILQVHITVPAARTCQGAYKHAGQSAVLQIIPDLLPSPFAGLVGCPTMHSRASWACNNMPGAEDARP